MHQQQKARFNMPVCRFKGHNSSQPISAGLFFSESLRVLIIIFFWVWKKKRLFHLFSLPGIKVETNLKTKSRSLWQKQSHKKTLVKDVRLSSVKYKIRSRVYHRQSSELIWQIMHYKKKNPSLLTKKQHLRVWFSQFHQLTSAHHKSVWHEKTAVLSAAVSSNRNEKQQRRQHP